jgi:acyl-CoA synthetase (AMP-forming)/AMP-acid ligase II
MPDLPRVAHRGELDTLVDLLCWRAACQPDRAAFSFLLDGESTEVTISYRELDRRARAIGAWLAAHTSGASPVVMVVCPPGLDFIAAFFGCLYAGMIAVPTYPPRPGRVDGAAASRLRAVMESAVPAAILTSSGVLAGLEPAIHGNGSPAPVVLPLDGWWRQDGHMTDGAVADALVDRWVAPASNRDALAMIQYTSGSTSAPRGSMLTHGNLLHNLEQICRRFGHTSDLHGVIWLPPYHDMGLIGGILQPVYVGGMSTLMSPLHMLQQPLRWLRAISGLQHVTSGGPNFAYETCVERITADDRADLDLSGWEVAFTGAEPVRADTLDRFAAAFEPCGFRPEAFLPCYGLAEATLMVSGGRSSPSDAKRSPTVRGISAAALERHRAEPVPAGASGARRVVGCGPSIDDQEMTVVDPVRLRRCEPGVVGEVWARGPSVGQGYWRDSEGTEGTFRGYLADTGDGPFLRTGDLGFVHDGALYVTGRIKDSIILDGRNHYAQDIELTVEHSHPAIRSGACAAFAVDGGGAESLVVLAEIERQYRSRMGTATDREPIVSAIRRAIAEHHDARVANVLLLKPASIAKTSSGKLQRHACRAQYLAGTLELV